MVQLTSFSVGLARNLSSPPHFYPCSYAYFEVFSRCALSTNFSAHCLKPHSMSSCSRPGVYIELFAFLLTALKVRFSFVETPALKRIQLLHNGSFDVCPAPFMFSLNRSRDILFTTAPFSGGHFGYVMRTDALYRFRKFSNLLSLLRPFSLAAWLSILFAIVAFWLLFALGLRRSWARSFWTTFVKFAGNAFADNEGRSKTVKACAFFFLVFAFFLQQIYTNTLTSYFVQPTLPQAIFATSGELADLVRNEGYHLADFQSTDSNFRDTLALSPLVSHRKMLAVLNEYPPRIFSEEADAQRALLEDEKLVFIASAGSSGAFSALTSDLRKCDELAMLEDLSTDSQWYGYGVNPQRRDLARRISTLIDMHQPIVKMIAFKYNMVGRCVTMPSDLFEVNVKTISMVDAGGTFILWTIGTVFCVIAFFIERVFENCH